MSEEGREQKHTLERQKKAQKKIEFKFSESFSRSSNKNTFREATAPSFEKKFNSHRCSLIEKRSIEI
jgi:anaerobic ribonucleoside-triphosphate reductase